MHTGGGVFYERVPIRETKRKNREETLNKIATRRNFQEEKTQNKRAAPYQNEKQRMTGIRRTSFHSCWKNYGLVGKRGSF
jgi:hypothetical protein